MDEFQCIIKFIFLSRFLSNRENILTPQYMTLHGFPLWTSCNGAVTTTVEETICSRKDGRRRQDI